MISMPFGGPGQFVVARDATAIPRGWENKTLDGYILGTHPSLPVAEIIVGDKLAGFLLGYAIRDGALVEQRIRFSSFEDNPDAAIEAELGALDGRYAVVIVSDAMQRIYLDPAGSLAAVFSPERQICASTTTLIGGDLDREVVDILGLPPANDFYPFGFTPIEGITRLIPNHYLDLRTFQVTRHWPKAPVTRQEGGAQLAASIAHAISGNIAAIEAKFPLLLSLTGGRDSRMLLACAKPMATNSWFFTREIDSSAALDRKLASRIAKDHSLQHEVFDYRPAKPEELEAWQVQTGHAVAGRWWKSLEALKRLPTDRMFLPGLMLEIGRGYYWGDTQPPATLTPEAILQKLRMPNTPLLRMSAASWLSSLRGMDALQILDLLYVEQRVGCWASPMLYGMKLNSLCMSPAVGRKIFTSMLQLPEDYRRNDRMAYDAINECWPELLAYPFNPRSFIRRTARMLKRGFRAVVSAEKYALEQSRNAPWPKE